MRALSVRARASAYEHSREHTHRPTDKTGGSEMDVEGEHEAEGRETKREKGGRKWEQLTI